MAKMKLKKVLAIGHVQSISRDMTEYFVPTGTLMVVKPIKKKSSTPAGIILEEKVLDSLNTMIFAEVIAIGPGTLSPDGDPIPITDIKKGDIVAYDSKARRICTHFTKLITTGDKERSAETEIIDYEDVLATIKNPDEAFKDDSTNEEDPSSLAKIGNGSST